MTKRVRKSKNEADKNEPLVPEVIDPEPVHVVDDIEVLPAEDESIDLPVEHDEVSDSEAETSRSTREISTLDPLSAYLREARRHPPLTREEERELAIRFFTSKEKEAGYRLVVSNLWLVVKIAREYEKAARNLLDLIQEGNIGLIEAVKNFDPYREVRFPSYAVWWVRAYIIRYIIANWRMVKIGTTQAQRKLFFNLKKEKERLEREGFFPAPKLLAEKLNVKEEEIVEMEQRMGASELSVDAPLAEDGDQTLHSLIPSTSPSAEENLAKREMQSLIYRSFDEFSSSLNEKERLIFKERMLAEDKVTLQDIAVKLNISRERVRQIENRLRERLKEFLADKLGNDSTEEFEF